MRALLKNCSRQYNQYMKLKNALRNNLIAILDETFPGVNKLFTSPVRADGHEKWVDFAEKYWHCELISSMSKRRFTTQFNSWSAKHGYHCSDEKAAQIHDMAYDLAATLPPTQGIKELITQAIAQLNNISFAIVAVKKQMQELARTLPEYPAVLAMRGVGRNDRAAADGRDRGCTAVSA